MVDPLTTANPLEFCILGTRMTQQSFADIFYTDTKWEGKLGELILWDHALTNSEMEGVSEYLRKKWISLADLESPKTQIQWGEIVVSTKPSLDPDYAITFFPNPVNDILEIQGLRGAEGVQILGLDGRVYQSIISNAGSMVVNIHSLPPGIYLLQVLSPIWQKSKYK